MKSTNSTRISTIFSLIFLTTVIAIVAADTKSENIIITELEQGSIQGIINHEDGKPFVEYLQIPLKLTDLNATKNNSVPDAFTTKNSKLEAKLLNCTYNTEVNHTHPDCLFLNVYTTKLNDSSPNDKMPVQFCIVREKEKCPKFNFDAGTVLIISEDGLQENVFESEDVLTTLIQEWMNKNIEKFGGDDKNIRRVSVISKEEIFEENPRFMKSASIVVEQPFVVGYELPESENVKPIHWSESMKFLIGKSKENETPLLEETTVMAED